MMCRPSIRCASRLWRAKLEGVVSFLPRKTQPAGLTGARRFQFGECSSRTPSEIRPPNRLTARVSRPPRSKPQKSQCFIAVGREKVARDSRAKFEECSARGGRGQGLRIPRTPAGIRATSRPAVRRPAASASGSSVRCVAPGRRPRSPVERGGRLKRPSAAPGKPRGSRRFVRP